MTIRRPTRATRATTTIVALLVLGFFMLSGGVGSADTASQLKAAEAKLNSLIADITSATAQANALQADLNAIAAQIDQNQAAIEKAQAGIVATQQAIAKLGREMAFRQNILDERAVTAYETGPASSIEFFLGAQSLNDLQDRIEIVNAAAQSDQELINGMQQRRNQLHVRQFQLQLLQGQLAAKLKSLQSQQQSLDSKFVQQQALLSRLASDRSQATTLVAQLKVKRQKEIQAARLAAAAAGFGTNHGGTSIPGVFHTCPVRGPHAYSDSFGAPRYAGGFHPHAGNDIMAPLHTPIVAPFDGVASVASNGLGGLAVIVRGSLGYTYNAHLVAFGQMGSVSTGTVVGYVGNSGDAQGGPTHDHFEWHPNVIPTNLWRSPYGYTIIGDAIDPYPYLNSVC